MSVERAEERVEAGGGPGESVHSAPAAPGTDRDLIPKTKTTITTIDKQFSLIKSILHQPINSHWFITGSQSINQSNSQVKELKTNKIINKYLIIN